MKRVICICNTYYQLIFSIQLKKAIYSNDHFSIILSDQSKNHVEIAKNLRHCNYFDEVYTAETKVFEGVRTNPLKLENDTKSIYNELKDYKYDEFLFYNGAKSSIVLWHLLYKTNPQIRSIKFEEGILSYNNAELKVIPATSSGCFDRPLFYARKLFPAFNLIENTKDFYCFYPSVYTGTRNPYKVPLIDKKEVGKVIAETFGVNRQELIYKEKYIFFTSVYDFEGGDAIGELELVKAIAEKVGKENLLIKMHPRDTRTVYHDEGFRIDANSAIPFEALLFAYDFSDKILLTATSGAVLSASLMHDNPPKTYYMYPLCKIDGNQAAKNTVEQIDHVLHHEAIKDSLMQICVCDSIDDLFAEDTI